VELRLLGVRKLNGHGVSGLICQCVCGRTSTYRAISLGRCHSRIQLGVGGNMLAVAALMVLPDGERGVARCGRRVVGCDGLTMRSPVATALHDA